MAQDIDPRGLGVYILVITSLALIWLSASLRAFVKFAIIKKVMLDDWLMFSSVVSSPRPKVPITLAVADLANSSSSPHTQASVFGALSKPAKRRK